MNTVGQKWVDLAKDYVRRYSTAPDEKEREDILAELADEDLAVLEAMVQFCGGHSDWMTDAH